MYKGRVTLNTSLWNFATIFGIRKQKSMGYLTALFVSLYVYAFWYNTDV